MTLGDLIKKHREDTGDSMDVFAKKSGLSKAYISILERNNNPTSNKPPIPSLEKIKQVSFALGMDFNDVIALLDGDQLVSLVDSNDEEQLLLPEAFPINPTHKIPLLGHVAAGVPLYAEQNVEGYIWTERNHGADYFGLRVHGDSMNSAGINDGDIVIVRHQDSVDEGEIAVIFVDDSATIKRYHQEGNMVILYPQSTNPENKTQIYNLRDHTIRILGRVMESRTEY